MLPANATHQPLAHPPAAGHLRSAPGKAGRYTANAPQLPRLTTHHRRFERCRAIQPLPPHRCRARSSRRHPCYGRSRLQQHPLTRKTSRLELRSRRRLLPPSRSVPLPLRSTPAFVPHSGVSLRYATQPTTALTDCSGHYALSTHTLRSLRTEPAPSVLLRFRFGQPLVASSCGFPDAPLHSPSSAATELRSLRNSSSHPIWMLSTDRNTSPRLQSPATGLPSLRSAGCLDRLRRAPRPLQFPPGARPWVVSQHATTTSVQNVTDRHLASRRAPMRSCHAPPDGGLPPAARRGGPALSLAPRRARSACALRAHALRGACGTQSSSAAVRSVFTKPTALLTEHRRPPKCGCLAQPLHVACRAQREQAPRFFRLYARF